MWITKQRDSARYFGQRAFLPLSRQYLIVRSQSQTDQLVTMIAAPVTNERGISQGPNASQYLSIQLL